ncbi:MAG TPA: hypothetical protein VJ794_08075 [Gemmatimonadales bacterium]|nr:hypothetical protein [Gemmatimonadales bacterium]
MDPLVIILRFIHVVSGAVWVGMVVFTTFFLMPAVAEAGPDGGKVMAGVQRRGVMTLLPILAIATLLSGLWLYVRAAAGMHAEFARSPVGMAFGLGGLAAILAWLVGMIVLRPSMLKAMALAQSLGPSTSADERQHVMAEAQRLRTRAAAASRATAWLLLIAVTAMAVARYL